MTSTHALHPCGTNPMTNSMYRELFQFLLKFLLKFLGIGLRGFGEFEDEISYRLKINSRIQKEKADGLPLFDGTIQSACKVSEEGNEILLMIFLNSNDGDSLQFEKSTLKDDNFTAQIRDVTFKTPVIVLSEISNHYHFTSSKSLGITKFPAVAIKTKLQDKFQTVLCYEGFLDVTMLMGLVQSVLLACESEIAQAAEISAMRALQSEQDAAYLKSFEIDKEKLRRKRESEASRGTAGIESAAGSSESQSPAQNLATKDVAFTAVVDDVSVESSKLDARIGKALLDLEDEPEDGNAVFKFQFLFPDGTRKIRKFSSESTTKSLFDFIFAAGVPLKNGNIAIRSIEPSIEFLENKNNNKNNNNNEAEAETKKLKEIEGIGRRMNLFIEYI